jgi:N-acetylglucosamine kinase-like BadF-type ATPase
MTEQATELVAVDAGGTRTRAVVVQPSGRCLGYAVSGSGNPIAVGARVAVTAVAESVSAALGRAGVAGAGTRLVVLAMAGAGSTSVTAELRHRLAVIGIDAPLIHESDLLATYCSGTHQPDGYAVVAGTGAGAIRVEKGRQVAVADGLGWLLGDDGSGFWIGQRVVRAVLADLDGRGPSTALTPLLLHRLAVPGPSGPGDREPVRAVVTALYAGPPVRLADFAALASDTDGDETSERILDDAAVALVQTLTAVRSAAVSGPVVLGGGILGRGPRVAERVAAACGADEVHAVTDGAVGAAVLALRHAGTHVDEAVFREVTTSLAAVR